MTSPPKKILYVINHMDWFWSHRLPLAKGAQTAGWDVHVAAYGAGNDAKLRALGFTGYDLPDPAAGYGPITAAKIIWRLRVILVALRPDCVHAITIKFAFLTGLAACLHRPPLLVHTIAGMGYLFSAESIKAKILRIAVMPLLRLALRHKRTQIIVQNPDDRALLLRRHLAIPQQCTLILGSGVDLKEFAQQPLPGTDSLPLILMPTRLVRDKGVAVFVAAARILHQRGIRARFAIAGGLSTHNPLALTASDMQDLTADGTVEWLGKVTDMPRLLSDATIIVYPSYYGEGIPKVLLEAAAIGRPIITTDHPGCRDVVRDGDNGYLVPIKDAAPVADAVQKLLNDPAALARMCVASRRRTEQDFDVRLIVAQTLQVYGSIYTGNNTL